MQLQRPTTAILSILVIMACTIFVPPVLGQASESTERTFPQRVLITNDNGIDDPKIRALARAFSKVAETWVFAPNRDRSGTGSTLSVTQTGKLEAEERDLGPGVRAYAVDGYPGDCVLLGLAGPMRDAPPDLVISGINGGANLGSDWMFSGTVGAARVAAFAGFPAMAVSGLDDDIPGAVDAVVNWVVRLAGSEAMQATLPPHYLSVSLPRVAPSAIRGFRITPRAPLQSGPRVDQTEPGVWSITGMLEREMPMPADSDQAASDDGYIAIVPMRVDETDLERIDQWRRETPEIPGWVQPLDEGR